MLCGWRSARSIGCVLPGGLLSIARDPKLARLEDTDVVYFEQLLGKKGVLTDEIGLQKYNRDWLGHQEGQSKLALFPSSTEEVSSVLRHCHRRRLGIVPQGGNTGLVQGSVPIFDEIILSTNKMHSVLDFNEVNGVLSCQAGCILESLEAVVNDKGFAIPLDLGAKGSCHIGGNLATNAGGIRLLRYGSLHGSVLGLETVLADGEVLNMMSSVRKDNTGYDLKQLFIGSEGTLGIITAATLQCAPLSAAQNACLLTVGSFQKALTVMQRARRQLGEILSAVEFMDADAYRLPFEFYKDLRNPLSAGVGQVYLLIETLGSRDDHDKEKLNGFLEGLMSDKMVVDGVLAQDSNQIRNMWKIRECVSQALPLRGAVYKYDVSLPFESMYTLVEDMRQRLTGHDCLVVGYGHLGDGNLHLNISTRSSTRSKKILNLIEPYVYEWTARHRGSISAEHGLGAMKAEYIGCSKTASAIKWMKRTKQLFDPKGILNPYKVLPRDEETSTDHGKS